MGLTEGLIEIARMELSSGGAAPRNGSPGAHHTRPLTARAMADEIAGFFRAASAEERIGLLGFMAGFCDSYLKKLNDAASAPEAVPESEPESPVPAPAGEPEKGE